jgi:cytidylate kinase
MTSYDRARGVVIAIDGPAGAGKSTLARDLAAALGVGYVNTGVMYRAVAVAALRLGLDRGDAAALAREAKAIRFGLDDGNPAALLVDWSRTPSRRRSRRSRATPRSGRSFAANSVRSERVER